MMRTYGHRTKGACVPVSCVHAVTMTREILLLLVPVFVCFLIECEGDNLTFKAAPVFNFAYVWLKIEMFVI